MEKEQILEKLTCFYEEAMKENQDLTIKLQQTAGLIAKSFDYELPAEKNRKIKIANLIRRVIRRSTRFITKPYAEKTRIYNENICDLLGDMQKRYTSKINFLSMQNEMLLHEVNKCNKRIDEIQEMLKQH